MTIELKVPSMVCEGCVETVAESLQKVDSGAEVNIDLETKVVKVETEASADSLKQAIAAVGHTVE
ncbi:MAG: heavy-metal-associated domain-containing protein [Oscillatoria sp. SIO1A7]|nr:heavy-metal-associated domain-containing protein [Oscillatoria sp. SIO1A7]